MAGRKPKPVGAIDNSISRRTQEELSLRERAEPKYDKKEFEPPTEMVDPVARRHWTELTAIWKDMRNGPVCDADRRTIQLACETWSDIEYCNEALRKKRDAFILVPTGGKDKDGKKKMIQAKNPYWDIRKKARDTYLKYCSELMLTPIGRAKVGKAGNVDEEEDDGFF